MIKTNFHTHTTFCDGKNTPEEMVIAAIEKGFSSLGFSVHSYFKKDASYTIKPDNYIPYKAEINRLKKEYQNKIDIFCGVELDYYSDKPKGFDYYIGSVHNVYKNGEYLTVDGSLDKLNEILKKHYNGDFDAFCEDYFKTVADVLNKTDADIIGHFDLILKNCERKPYTPTNRFFDAAEKAVKALIPYGKPFEINTGAIARGYRTAPYPHPEILKMIKDMGGSICLSSDCHNKDYLECGLEAARKLALDVGFKEQAVITENGIEYVKL
jgi:histidinol-phosphatase (PHP family)